MNEFSLVYPMAAMVILSFTVLAVMFRSRVRAVAEGEVTAAYFKTYQVGAEPAYAAQLSRHFTNLYETPVLFYAACLTAMITGQSGLLLQIFAWGFVLSRVAHFVVHTGRNKLQPRIATFFVSCLAIAAMWVTLTINVAMAG